MSEKGLIKNLSFSGNWFIDKVVYGALEGNAKKGWFNEQERIYLGNTTHLSYISAAFISLATESQNTKKRLSIRKSCVNNVSFRYHLLSIYLDVRPPSEYRKVYQAVWTAPIRLRDEQIKEQITDQFKELMSFNFESGSPQFTEGF